MTLAAEGLEAQGQARPQPRRGHVFAGSCVETAKGLDLQLHEAEVLETPPADRPQVKKRRLVETAKFYLFDVGAANQLHPEAHVVAAGSDRFGRAFEHLMLNEVRAFLEYRRLDHPISFWRTSSGCC